MGNFDLFDDYDFEPPATLEEERPQQERHRGGGSSPDRLYNALTLFFLAASVGMCLLVVALIQNPTLPINPFPPPTPQPTPTLFLLESAGSDTGEVVGAEQLQTTPTSNSARAEETVTPTIDLTAMPTASPTVTLTPAPSPTGMTPLPVATNTPSSYPFTVQNETVTYVAYTGPEGCNYMAIAGQVFDVSGKPLKDMIIWVKDTEGFFEMVAFSGQAPRYGPSGYEAVINTSPYEADFTVQVWSDTGTDLSAPVAVHTKASCDENLAIVNFVQNRPAP